MVKLSGELFITQKSKAAGRAGVIEKWDCGIPKLNERASGHRSGFGGVARGGEVAAVGVVEGLATDEHKWTQIHR